MNLYQVSNKNYSIEELLNTISDKAECNIIIFGPTGSGKTKIAKLLADKLNTNIISADSRQIYKNVEIGTGIEKFDNIETKLIEFLDVNFRFSVFDWNKKANEIIKNQKINIIAGGTGLYLDSLIYKHQYTNDIKINELNKRHRDDNKIQKKEKNINKDYLLITPNIEKDILYKKINDRVIKMFNDGFIDEVKALINMGYKDTEFLNGAGYKEIKEYLLYNSVSKENLILKVQQKYRNYAKRQITWFKKYFIDFPEYCKLVNI